MSLSFQMLMKKAAAQTRSAQKETANLIAQRDAAQKKARQEQEAREAKEREARKAQLLYEMEAKRKAEAEALRKEQREMERQLEGDRHREGGWTPPASKRKAGPSVQNKAVRQVQEASDKSRSSSPRPGAHQLDRSTLSREEKRALTNPLLRERVTESKPKIIGSKSTKRLGGSPRNPNVSPSKSPKSYASARDRIAAEHVRNELIVLNTVKKDMRTIDEITRDLERQRNGQERVELVGPDATGFTDWFGKSRKEKEKETKERQEQQLERERAEREKLQEEQARAHEVTAKKAAATPRSAPTSSSSARPGSLVGWSKSSSTQSRPIPRPSLAGTSSTPSPALAPSKASMTQASPTSILAGPSSRKRPHPQNSDPETDIRKHARLQSQDRQRYRAPDPDDYDSEIMDDEEEEEGEEGSSFRYVPGTIAALLGRNIQRDAQRELSSSGSESEGDATGGRRKPKSYGYEELMREERRSAMLAKKEDEAEEARLKKHEEMKRRKKEARSREMRAKSGSADYDS